MTEEFEMGLEDTIRLTEMDKGRNKKDRVGMQIADPNLVIGAKALKERMDWNAETMFEVIFEDDDLTWLGVWEAFALR